MVPLLDEDFMPGGRDRRKRTPLDEKGIKRKIKAEEKIIIRDLRKDTMVVQQEKAKRKTQRLAKARKATFRGGNAPVDEL